MIENEIKPPASLNEMTEVSAPDEIPKTTENTTNTKPTSFKEDPDYLAIRDKLNKEQLGRNSTEALSDDHQEYLFGNPAERTAPTLDQDAERVFREQHADRAAEYDKNEKAKVYDKIDDDPAYRELQEKITIQTNTDSQVSSASRSGKDWGGTWDRVNRREHINGMDDFTQRYPEKAQAYADRWSAFVDKHPEIANINNAQWNTWCDKQPGAFASMNECRNMARAVERIKRRDEMNTMQPQIHEAEQSIAEIRANLGIDKTIPKNEAETPLSRQKERLNDLQLKDIVSEIKTSIPAEIQLADTETLKSMQKKLADLPYVPGEAVREILDYDGEDEGVMMVKTDSIVGSISPAFKNWSTEYEGRKGRVVDVARKLMEGTEESANHVFHVKDIEHGIKLKKLSGPDGDLFFAVDGTHRVAGSKLAQLPELPARVENMTKLSEVQTTDPLLKSQWEERISRGLIRGTIEEATTTANQKKFNLKIDSQVLPWMNLPQDKLIKMTKFYFEQHPKSLDNLKSYTTGEKIPKEALLDQVAMNFYLAGRWNEYKLTEIPEQNQPETQQEGEKIDSVQLEKFDMAYFKSLEGEDGWIAIGQENCKNQRYFTVCNEDGKKVGIIGVYDTEDDQNITHTVVDPKYRGQGLAAKCKDALMDKLNLPFVTLTVDLDNKSSLRATEKLSGVKKVSDAKYEADFHKSKYIFTRPENNESSESVH